MNYNANYNGFKSLIIPSEIARDYMLSDEVQAVQNKINLEIDRLSKELDAFLIVLDEIKNQREKFCNRTLEINQKQSDITPINLDKLGICDEIDEFKQILIKTSKTIENIERYDLSRY